MKTISANDFSKAHIVGVHAVDVRTAAEHAGMHVRGAISIPLHELNAALLKEKIVARGFVAGDTVYLLCQAGRRAQMAAELLASAPESLSNFFNIVVVEGGTDACVAAGAVTESNGNAVMSLERQVRIAAGFLVLSGVLLGVFVAPAWVGLSGFVGAGLMFAGITNTCAMGMVISRMPWNR